MDLYVPKTLQGTSHSSLGELIELRIDARNYEGALRALNHLIDQKQNIDDYLWRATFEGLRTQQEIEFDLNYVLQSPLASVDQKMQASIQLLFAEAVHRTLAEQAEAIEQLLLSHNLADRQQLRLLQAAAVHYRALENFPLALDCYSRALAIPNLSDSRRLEIYLCRSSIFKSMGRFQDAMHDLDEAGRLPAILVPDGARLLFDRAYLLSDAGEKQLAIETYQTIIADDRFDSSIRIDSRINLAYVLCELNQVDEAIGEWQVVATHPSALASQRSHALLLIGDSLSSQKRFADAIATYSTVSEHADASQGDRIKATFNIAYCVSKTGDQSRAIKIYTDIINDPASDLNRQVRCYYNRGKCYFDRNEYQAAFDDFNYVIEYGDVNLDERVKAFTNRGLCAAYMGDSAAAIDDYKAVINYSTSIPVDRKATALFNLAREIGKSDPKNAIVHYSQILDMKGVSEADRIDSMINRGFKYQELKRFEESDADFETVINLQPEKFERRIQATRGLGENQRLQNQLASAVDLLLQALALNENQFPTHQYACHWLLALCFQDLGDLSAAEFQLKQIVRNPQEAGAWRTFHASVRIADILSEVGGGKQKEAAVYWLEEFLKLPKFSANRKAKVLFQKARILNQPVLPVDVDNLVARLESCGDEDRVAEFYGCVGWLYFEAQDYSSMLAYSRKAVELDDSLYFAGANVALAYFKLDILDRSETTYRELIRKMDNSKEIDRYVVADLKDEAEDATGLQLSFLQKMLELTLNRINEVS